MYKALLPLSLFIAFLCLQSGVADVTVLCLYGDWEALISHPWSILTYAFIHLSAFHLVPILGVFFILISLTKKRLSVSTYYFLFFLGVISGALMFILIESLSPASMLTSLTGASSGLTALVAYCLLKMPQRYNLFLRILSLVFIIIADRLTLSLYNDLGFYSHLSGYLFGAGVALFTTYRTNKNRKLVDHKTILISKANNSGYASLSDSEKQIIRKPAEDKR
ncbi:MAG: rhomboid family intramembrane serine protease [Porphyromonas sp.]|nr:rhomboid family intramembrane serine protease [Porphyromonas sp.]